MVRGPRDRTEAMNQAIEQPGIAATAATPRPRGGAYLLACALLGTALVANLALDLGKALGVPALGRFGLWRCEFLYGNALVWLAPAVAWSLCNLAWGAGTGDAALQAGARRALLFAALTAVVAWAGAGQRP